MERGYFFVPVLFLVLIQTFADTAKVLHCFQCQYTDKGCDVLSSLNTTSPYYLPCPSESSFCRKIKQTIVSAEKTIITRNCGWLTEYAKQPKCIKFDTQFKYETTCECYEDGCNSAYSAIQQLQTFPLLVGFGMVLIINRLLLS